MSAHIDFGARLREARERKGISLRQIAGATKISVAALEALERNDISRLPGGIFSRAFVRSYAIEVGLDPDETVRQFLAHFAGEPAPPIAPGMPSAVSAPPLASSLGASRGAPPKSRPSPASVRASVRSTRAAVPRDAAPAPEGVSEEMEFESRQRMASVVLKLVLLSLPIAVAIVYFNSRAATPSAREEEPAPAAEAAPPPPETTSLEPAPPGTPPPDIAGAEESRSALREPASAAADAGQAEGVTIEIVPTSECWVQLTTDGTLALSRVLQPGERESHRFTAAAVLQVGDAAACTFFLNGRAARPLGRPRQVREVTITTENYMSLLP